MTKTGLGSGESKLETIVSYLLIIGVVTSVALISVGIFLYYESFGNVQISQQQNAFIHGENFFAFIYAQISNLFAMENALAFITVGMIILILTPYIRAITSLAYFAWEKNPNYVLITLFVLIVLTVSLAVH